jgi:hypothetical protein
MDQEALFEPLPTDGPPAKRRWYVPREPLPPPPPYAELAAKECPHGLTWTEHDGRIHVVGYVFEPIPGHWTDLPHENLKKRFVRCISWVPNLRENERPTSAWIRVMQAGLAPRAEVLPSHTCTLYSPPEAR